MIFEAVSTLFLTPFILRTVGQAEFGVYKLSAAITVYLFLLDLGIGNAVIKYSSEFRIGNEPEKQRMFLGVTTIYYGAIALIALIAGTVLYFIYPYAFATGLTADEIVLGQKLLGITAINVAVTLGTSAFANVLIAYERFYVSKGWSIIQIFLRVALVVLALKSGMGSIAIVLINLLLTVLCRVFFILYVIYALKLRPHFSGIRFSFIKEIVFYSSWILLQMIATQINSFVDQVLLGILVPAASVIIGIYGVGTQIVQYYQSMGVAFTSVLMPGVVRFVKTNDDPKFLCGEMVRIGRMIFAFLGLIWVGFLLFGKRFIILWVGEDSLDAYFVTMVLMSAYLFILTESIGTQIMWARNEHKEQSILKFVIVLLNIVLTIFLIKWEPLRGATIGTFISLFLGDVIVMNVIFRWKLKISLTQYYWGLFKGIVPCLAITFTAGWFLRYIPLNGWLGFAVCIAALVLVYGVSMLLFGFNKYEKGLIGSIIKKIFRRKKQHESV